MKCMTDMMNAMSDLHLRVADTFWMKALVTLWSSFTWICIWTLLSSPEWSEWLESSLPRRGGGVNDYEFVPEADLNRWIMKSWWSWNASKLIIQTWPCCWTHTWWYSRASRWSLSWLSLTAPWLPWNEVTFATPDPTLNTWDNEWSLKRLSLGRWLPNTGAWTNFVRTSEGLWWVPTFSSDMTPSLRMSWIHKCLSSMCFDFLVLSADESVLRVIFTSLERIADFSSLMMCLIANESTAAWAMAYSSASALECETDAWVQLFEDRLTENNVMSEPLVDLLDLSHPAQSESE